MFTFTINMVFSALDGPVELCFNTFEMFLNKHDRKDSFSL